MSSGYGDSLRAFFVALFLIGVLAGAIGVGSCYGAYKLISNHVQVK